MINLTSLLTASTLIGLILSIAVPETQQAMLRARGETSTANIRMIEAAKREFAVNWPNESPTISDIAYLLPNHEIPKGAHIGEIYSNVDNLSALTTSNVNGLPDYEPRAAKGNVFGNGFNDLGRASIIARVRPGLSRDQQAILDYVANTPPTMFSGTLRY